MSFTDFLWNFQFLHIRSTDEHSRIINLSIEHIKTVSDLSSSGCLSSDALKSSVPFENYYDDLINISKPAPLDSTYKTIPQFYHKLPKSGENVPQKLREEARTLFLQKRSTELLDNTELKALWGLLEKNYTPPLVNTEQFISYDDYLKVIRIAGEKCK